MSKYAIIQLAGNQHKVMVGDKLTVNRLDQEEGKEFKVSEVLLIGDEKTQTVGAPLVEKASVSFKLLENNRSKKLTVGKFKAKSRYRRVRGHRQHQSLIEVTKITG